MSALFLYVVLLYAGLTVVLAIVASLMYSSFYDQMLEGLVWRALLASFGIVAFLVIWALIESRWPGRFDSLFRYSSSNDIQFEQFWSEKQSDAGVSESLYRRRIVPPGRVEYTNADGRPWRRSDSGVVTAIIVEENGERRRFAAQLGPDSFFLRDPANPNAALEVRYVEEGGQGRVMTENNIGTLANPRYGALLGNTLFNLAFLVVWIVCVGVSMELGWGHAFVIGLIGWVATLLLIWPPLQGFVAALPVKSEVAAHCRELIFVV